MPIYPAFRGDCTNCEYSSMIRANLTVHTHNNITGSQNNSVNTNVQLTHAQLEMTSDDNYRSAIDTIRL